MQRNAKKKSNAKTAMRTAVRPARARKNALAAGKSGAGRISTRKRKAGNASARRTAGRKKELLVRNLEELVVMNLVAESISRNGSSMTVQDLILSLTDSTRRLGYAFGFGVGRQMNQYGEANIEVLFAALDKLGLGKVLYYPSLEHATITSIKPKATRISIGMPVHVIEAGIVAGYLSGYLGTGIRVRESLCTYMGSDVCQFVAEQVSAHEYPAVHMDPDINLVIKAIAEKINSTETGQVPNGESRYYLVLPSMPLMRGQVLNESSDVLYLAGAELAMMHPQEDYRIALGKIAAYFDLDGAEVREAKGKRVIRLNYKQYNSIDGLVRLSSSMVMGFLETMFKSEPRKKTGIGSNRAYFVELTV